MLFDAFDYLLSFVTFNLNNEFKSACIDAQIIRPNLSLEEYLKLYGLFKRSVYGKCHFNTFVDSPEKKEHWIKCNHMSIRAAKQKYIDLVNFLKLKYDTEISNFGSMSRMKLGDNKINGSNDRLDIFHLINQGEVNELADLLKKNPTLVTSKGDDGITPLHLAADRDLPEIVKLLLETGMDVNARDDFGDTPLDVAIIANARNCIDFLTSKGAVAHQNP